MSENENVVQFPSPLPAPDPIMSEKPFVRITWYANGKMDIEQHEESAPIENGALLRFLGSLAYCVWALTEWANRRAIQRGLHEAALSEFLANLPSGGVEH